MTRMQQDEMMDQIIQAEAGLKVPWETAYAWWKEATASSPIDFFETSLALHDGHPHKEQAVKLVRGAYALRRT